MVDNINVSVGDEDNFVQPDSTSLSSVVSSEESLIGVQTTSEFIRDSFLIFRFRF